MNPLQQLGHCGQAVWLDDLSRSLISSGKLQKMIDEDELRGITSNPAIFEKSISHTQEYDHEIERLAREHYTASNLLDALCIADVQDAADVLRPTYEQTHHLHGFVSLEVNPHLAHETTETIAEARRLWESVARPNVFIKVPGTQAGVPAIQQLIREGINVNVTLLFGLNRYREVAHAFLQGLRQRTQDGNSLEDVHSVASFFLSRIDVLVDPLLQKIVAREGQQADQARRLKGQVAIASAWSAYQIYLDNCQSEDWLSLQDQGARRQWLLWASTSTKNPDYRDVKYVEALIAPETVNTMPMNTLDAFRDHGRVALHIDQSLADARRQLEELKQLGISLDDVAQQLEDEGVEKFNQPYDKLREALQQKVDDIHHAHPAGSPQ